MRGVGGGRGGLILCWILLWRAQNLGGRDSEKVRSGGSGGGGSGVAGLN